jgi:hypothetical protein
MPEGRPKLLDVVRQEAQETTARMDAVWEARERLYVAIARAAEEGISNARIARAASLSRERVRQIVEQQREMSQRHAQGDAAKR